MGSSRVERRPGQSRKPREPLSSECRQRGKLKLRAGDMPRWEQPCNAICTVVTGMQKHLGRDGQTRGQVKPVQRPSHVGQAMGQFTLPRPTATRTFSREGEDETLCPRS